MSLSTPQQVQERLDNYRRPTPQEALERLDRMALELDLRSMQLHKVDLELETVEAEYERVINDHEIGLWRKHEDDGAKFPSEVVRRRLAHHDMDPVLLGRYVGLVNSRKRLEKRIAALKAEADSARSILSALKTEAEATR